MNLVNVLDGEFCTGIIGKGIPAGVAGVVHLIFMLIQVVVPILLILWGMLDFAKAIIGQDEDKIKAGQKKFIQRLIAAIVVFLVVTLVQLVISVVGSVGATDEQSGTAWTCAKCLIDNDASKCNG